MKTLRWIVQSQSGFSLIEIMIVSAMMAGVAMVSTKMSSNQMKNAKTIEKKFGVIQEAESQKFLLSKSVNCNKTLENVDLDDLGGGAEIDVPSLMKSDGVSKWTPGTDYDNGNINLESVKLTGDFEVDPDNPLYGDINLRVNWKKNGRFYGPEKVYKDIPLRVTVDASNVIQNCYTTSGGDGGASLWQEHVDGIYYSDAIAAKVTIGKDPSAAVATFEFLGNAAIGTNSSVTTTTGLAFGGSSSADYSLALGERASASDDASIAIGSSLNAGYVAASGDGSTAIGSANTWNPHASSQYNKGALATGDGSVAIGGAGYDPTTTAWPSIAQREGAKASGDYSIAMGVRSEAEEMNSISIGVVSWAGSNSAESGNRPYSIAIGHNSYSMDSKTIALGYRSYAGEAGTNDSDTDNASAIAIGETVYAYDKYSIAIGSSAVTGNSDEDPGAVGEGDESIAIGRSSRAYDKRSIAIGPSSTAGKNTIGTDKQNGIAIGYSSSSTESNTIAIGQSASSSSSDGIAIGQSSVASQSAAIAIGKGAVADEIYSIVIGDSADVSDSYGIAIGYGANAAFGGAYDGPIAIGKDAKSAGRGIAIGYEAEAEAGSYVIGYKAVAKGELHIAIGGDITHANSDRNIVIGYGAKISSNVDESMVISSDWGASVDVTSSNKFLAHFDNGFDFCTGNTADPCSTKMTISSTGNAAITSDKNKKTRFEKVDPEEFVNRFFDLDIFWWNYKTDLEDKDRHVGPMAQDFKKAFGTYGKETMISQMDMRGVNMLGIKGLAIKNRKLAGEVEELRAENDDLRVRLERIESILEKLDK